MNQICDCKKCTGCHACYSVCNVKAIQMKPDQWGFLHPQIDTKKCISCGKCVKICPVNKKITKEKPLDVYAAISNNRTDYETTTSGGIATLLSKKILQRGGVVYGAAFCGKTMTNRHIQATTEEEINRLKGSKYVQSIIGDTFVKVLFSLTEGKEVLFIGTPCQVAGLKAFLGRDYKQLLCIDIVCHGVPSNLYLREHLKALNINEDIDSISFREKDGFYLSCYKDGALLYRKSNFRDVYYQGFLKGLFYRECCYTCEYACSDRVGDITLGDFWGFKNELSEFPAKYDCGLSLVFINKSAGRKLFDLAKDSIIFTERTLSEAVEGNKQLREPSRMHRNHKRFLKLYLKDGFEKSAKRALLFERMAYFALDKLGKK